MKKSELLDFMQTYDIEYTYEKELPNGVLFPLKQCPFCDGRHTNGAYIIYNPKGYVIAKCHHESCKNVSFSQLYEAKTGKTYITDNKSGVDGSSEYKHIDKLIEDGLLELFYDEFGNPTARVQSVDKKSMICMPLYSGKLRVHIQFLLYERTGEMRSKQDYEPIKDYLLIQTYKQNTKRILHKRICNLGDKIIYELDKDSNVCVVVTKDEITISDEEKVYFYHSKYCSNQVMPVFDKTDDSKLLITLLNKHFNFTNNDTTALFAIYLVSCFLGTGINHPLMSISGSKGSGKSSAIRRFCDLVDPKLIGLGNIPKNENDLCLKVSQSYVTDFDNLSYLNKDISNLLCRCVTGGCESRRTLYENMDETIFNLKSIIVMNGIDVVIKESDLIDRTVFFNLKRLEAGQLKTEVELNEEFEKDKPVILGLCFAILQRAMNDTEPIDRSQMLRMADFFEWAIKIGRAIGYKDEYIVRILKKNQKQAVYQSLEENPVAYVLLNYMEYHDERVHTVSDLLSVLKKVAGELQVDQSYLPKKPNVLSRKLNEIENDLKEEGISFEVKNKGYGKVITIKNSKAKRVPIEI